jgi:hypothetical protein
VRIDQLSVEATVTLADDLEVGAHANFIALEHRTSSPFRLEVRALNLLKIQLGRAEIVG